MAYIWKFSVMGVRAFPLDMLRYDVCIPATQISVRVIHDSFNEKRLDTITRELLVVELVSYNRAPTRERWMAFGWSLGDVKRERV